MRLTVRTLPTIRCEIVPKIADEGRCKPPPKDRRVDFGKCDDPGSPFHSSTPLVDPRLRNDMCARNGRCVDGPERQVVKCEGQQAALPAVWLWSSADDQLWHCKIGERATASAETCRPYDPPPCRQQRALVMVIHRPLAASAIGLSLTYREPRYLGRFSAPAAYLSPRSLPRQGQ